MLHRLLNKHGVYLWGCRSKFVHKFYLLIDLQNITVMIPSRQQYRGERKKGCRDALKGTRYKNMRCLSVYSPLDFSFGIQRRTKTFTSFHLASMWWSILFHAWHFYEYVYMLGILQELQDGIGRQQTVVKALNVTGEEIIEQSSAADAKVLKEQLESLNIRWQEICRQLVEKKKR